MATLIVIMVISWGVARLATKDVRAAVRREHTPRTEKLGKPRGVGSGRYGLRDYLADLWFDAIEDARARREARRAARPPGWEFEPGRVRRAARWWGRRLDEAWQTVEQRWQPRNRHYTRPTPPPGTSPTPPRWVDHGPPPPPPPQPEVEVCGFNGCRGRLRPVPNSTHLDASGRTWVRLACDRPGCGSTRTTRWTPPPDPHPDPTPTPGPDRGWDDEDEGPVTVINPDAPRTAAVEDIPEDVREIVCPGEPGKPCGGGYKPIDGTVIRDPRIGRLVFKAKCDKCGDQFTRKVRVCGDEDLQNDAAHDWEWVAIGTTGLWSCRGCKAKLFASERPVPPPGEEPDTTNTATSATSTEGGGATVEAELIEPDHLRGAEAGQVPYEPGKQRPLAALNPVTKKEEGMSTTATEVTGLETARWFAHELATRTYGREQQAGLEQFIADLQANGVSGEAITRLQEAMEYLSAAQAEFAAVAAELDRHTGVAEAYAATPGAGDKAFVTSE